MVVGMGTLVSEYHILTCVHVITQALNIPRNTSVDDSIGLIVTIDYPLAGVYEDLSKFDAKVVSWHTKEDIAILKVLEDPPLSVYPLEQISFKIPKVGNKFTSFGIPKGFKWDGQESYGIIKGEILNGKFQLEKEGSGFKIKKGYSGALVWDNDLNKMVGMIVASATGDEASVAYMISMNKITQILNSKLLKRVFPQFSTNKGSSLAFDKDKGLVTLREIFDDLEFDREQYFKFQEIQLEKKEKQFSFVIHGNDFDYGQRWLLNKIIRDFNLRDENILKHNFNSRSSGNEIDDLIDEIGKKLEISSFHLSKKYIIRKLYERLQSKNFILVLKCKSASFAEKYIFPFCSNLLIQLRHEKVRNKLICLITIDETTINNNSIQHTYLTEHLPAFSYKHMKRWVMKNDTKPIMYQLFHHCYNMEEHERKRYYELLIQELSGSYSESLNSGLIEIPAERFMRKFIKKKLNIDWVKFEEKWIIY